MAVVIKLLRPPFCAEYTGESARNGQTLLNSLFHSLPHGGKKFENLLALAKLHILPKPHIVRLAVIGNFGVGVKGVDVVVGVFFVFFGRLAVENNRAAAPRCKRAFRQASCSSQTQSRP